MFGFKNLTKCAKCRGNLLPKKHPQNRIWILTCENRAKNRCHEITLDDSMQEVFKKLMDWNINEFDCHDIIKIGKKGPHLINSIDFIERIDIKLIKKRIEALKSLLRLPFGFFINKVFIRIKYKFTPIYSFFKVMIFSFLFLFIVISISIINRTYKKDYLLLSKASLVNSEDTRVSSEELKKLIKDEQNIDINADTDGDGLTDLEEEKIGTNPNNKDTDGDGYDYKQEVDGGYDPLDNGQRDTI